MQALLFDCDGVLADTERDGHRVAFNQAFERLGLAPRWSVERYADLLRTAGGKERILRSFEEDGWPMPEEERDGLVSDLHELKTGLFMNIVGSGKLPLRTGVARLVDEALVASLKVAVCSTSNEKAVQSIIDQLGPDRAKHIALFTGDTVKAKKPDPAIYTLAATTLGVDPAHCVAIEDSSNGLRATLAAGMACIVTTASYTGGEDFAGAAQVVSELGDPPSVQVTLADCRRACDRVQMTYTLCRDEICSSRYHGVVRTKAGGWPGTQDRRRRSGTFGSTAWRPSSCIVPGGIVIGARSSRSTLLNCRIRPSSRRSQRPSAGGAAVRVEDRDGAAGLAGSEPKVAVGMS